MLFKIVILASLLEIFVRGIVVEVITPTPCKIEVKKNGEVERYIEFLLNYGVIVNIFSISGEAPWSRTFTSLLTDCDNCPATVAQLDRLDAENYTYQISLVDGFNRKISIETGNSDVCRRVACLEDINAICPINNQVLDNGTVIACAPDPEVFQEACPEAVTTPDDLDNIVTCNDTLYSINFDYE